MRYEIQKYYQSTSKAHAKVLQSLIVRWAWCAEMAHELMAALRRSSIDFIVAPYEADSQLAFLTQAWPCSSLTMSMTS